MAATQIFKSVTFNGTAITSIVAEVHETPNGTVNRLHTDSARSLNLIFGDVASATITVPTSDSSFKTQWPLFTAGQLVVVKQYRKLGGDNDTALSTITSTYATVVLTAVDDTAPITGNSVLTLTFEACNNSGGPVVVYS